MHNDQEHANREIIELLKDIVSEIEKSSQELRDIKREVQDIREAQRPKNGF